MNFHYSFLQRLSCRALLCGVFASQLQADPAPKPAVLSKALSGRFNSKLILGKDGNFYGTTHAVFPNYGDAPLPGMGSIFKMTPLGKITTLANLGKGRPSNLIQGNDGSFYCTISEGGKTKPGVLKITSAGKLTVLAYFSDSSEEFLTFIQGSDNNFYGIPVFFGLSTGSGGSIFKLTLSGNLTTRIDFKDFIANTTSLIQGLDGKLYGTTWSGANNPGNTVFTVTSSGTLTTLVNLPIESGAPNVNSLIQSRDGNLYVTTEGDYNPKYENIESKISRISNSGVLTTLASFKGFINDFIESTDGNFYGMTYSRNYEIGKFPSETIFKMEPSGTVTTLVKFTDKSGERYSGLTQGIDGNFYGTTYDGGSNGKGYAFKMTPSGQITTLFKNDPKEPEMIVKQPNGKKLGGYLTKKYFGKAKRGEIGTSVTFKIVNEGAIKLTGLSVEKYDPEKRDFIISSLHKNSLDPMESTTFTVTFRPSGKGKREAELSIPSNDPDYQGRPFTIQLSGYGTKP